MAKILLIDDSADIRALVCLLLRQGGHTVVEAEDGRVGLDLVRQTRPDLVLTDLALPGLSGWDITRILKSDPELAEIPVVALTAHAMRGDRERALATGCDGFIVKPIDDEKFEPTIRSYLKTQDHPAGIPARAATHPGSRAPRCPSDLKTPQPHQARPRLSLARCPPGCSNPMVSPGASWLLTTIRGF